MHRCVEAPAIFFSRIHWNRTVAEHYGARVVQPKTVIGVRVCKKDGRKVLESDPESRWRKSGRRVDEYVLTAMFDQHRGP